MSTNLAFYGKNNYVTTTLSSIIDALNLFAGSPYIEDNFKTEISSLVKDLDNLKIDWSNGWGKCLNRTDLKILHTVCSFVSSMPMKGYFYSATIPNRIRNYNDVLQKVPDNRVFEVITGQPHTNRNWDMSVFKKIYDVKKSTALFIDTVIERNYSGDTKYPLLDISTILLLIVIRSEAHEYQINKMLKRAEIATHTQFDISDLLSVDKKEIKGGETKPDTRAIRDATAHAHFRINTTQNNNFIIKFENKEDKWQFKKTFNRHGLLNFYQVLDRLYNIYTLLLSLRLLYYYLITNSTLP